MGNPHFGKLYPCPKCNQDGITQRAGLYPNERVMSLADIGTKGRPGAAAMVKAGRALLEQQAGMLAVHGGYGNGKSTFLKALTAELVRAGVEARYTTLAELLQYAREAFDNKMAGDTDAGRIKEWANLPAVLVDECDKVRVSEYAREIQTYFFDIRYRRAGELLTVAAWNGGRDGIGLPWVISRFSEYSIIENRDADMRPLLGGAE
jgi:chromosomal replication initiation ATPase DnaA